MLKICESCQAPFNVEPHRTHTAKFCSKSCLGRSNGLRQKRNGMVWGKGHRPWSKDMKGKGIHLSPLTEFRKGQTPSNRLPIGSVTIRTDKHGKKRAWIKIGEPKTWKVRAVFIWESAHGPVPSGLIVHHKDRNSLHDDISNLAAITRAAHGAEHRLEVVLSELKKNFTKEELRAVLTSLLRELEAQKFNPDGTAHGQGSWFKIADSKNRGTRSARGEVYPTHPVLGSDRIAEETEANSSATKNNGGSWFAIAHNTTSGHGQNPDGRKVGKDWSGGYGGGFGGDCSPMRRNNSKSPKRKAASAQIAKIPLPLAQHIAKCFA